MKVKIFENNKETGWLPAFEDPRGFVRAGNWTEDYYARPIIRSWADAKNWLETNGDRYYDYWDEVLEDYEGEDIDSIKKILPAWYVAEACEGKIEIIDDCWCDEIEIEE